MSSSAPIIYQPIMRRRSGPIGRVRPKQIGNPTAIRESWSEVLHRDPCPYCGLRKPRMNRDHVVPKARGGEDSINTNIVGTCRCCNLRKGSASLLHFLLATPTQPIQGTEGER